MYDYIFIVVLHHNEYEREDIAYFFTKKSAYKHLLKYRFDECIERQTIRSNKWNRGEKKSKGAKYHLTRFEQFEIVEQLIKH